MKVAVEVMVLVQGSHPMGRQVVPSQYCGALKSELYMIAPATAVGLEQAASAMAGNSSKTAAQNRAADGVEGYFTVSLMLSHALILHMNFHGFFDLEGSRFFPGMPEIILHLHLHPCIRR